MRLKNLLKLIPFLLQTCYSVCVLGLVSMIKFSGMLQTLETNRLMMHCHNFSCLYTLYKCVFTLMSLTCWAFTVLLSYIPRIIFLYHHLFINQLLCTTLCVQNRILYVVHKCWLINGDIEYDAWYVQH